LGCAWRLRVRAAEAFAFISQWPQQRRMGGAHRSVAGKPSFVLAPANQGIEEEALFGRTARSTFVIPKFAFMAMKFGDEVLDRVVRRAALGERFDFP
jgi:hypothetical protein